MSNVESISSSPGFRGNIRVPGSTGSLWELRDELAQLLGRKVDLIPKDNPHWVIRDHVLAEAARALLRRLVISLAIGTGSPSDATTPDREDDHSGISGHRRAVRFSVAARGGPPVLSGTCLPSLASNRVSRAVRSW